MARQTQHDHPQASLQDFLRCLGALGGRAGEAAKSCHVSFNRSQWSFGIRAWNGAQVHSSNSAHHFYPDIPDGMQSTFARDIAQALIEQDIRGRSVALAGGSSRWSDGEIIAGIAGLHAAPHSVEAARPAIDAALELGLLRAQTLWAELNARHEAIARDRARLAAERSMMTWPQPLDPERIASRLRFDQIDQKASDPASDSDLAAMRWLALKANGLELFEIDPPDPATAHEREPAWRQAHQMLINAKTKFDIPLLYEDLPIERDDGPDEVGPYQWIECLASEPDEPRAVFQNPMAAALWLGSHDKALGPAMRGGMRYCLKLADGEDRSFGGYGSGVREWIESTIARLEGEMIAVATLPGPAVRKPTL